MLTIIQCNTTQVQYKFRRSVEIVLGWFDLLLLVPSCIILFHYTGWPKSWYTVIKLFFICFEVACSALYVTSQVPNLTSIKSNLTSMKSSFSKIEHLHIMR